MCTCNFAWKGRPRSDLYCIWWDAKPYSLTHSLTHTRRCAIWTDDLYLLPLITIWD